MRLLCIAFLPAQGKTASRCALSGSAHVRAHPSSGWLRSASPSARGDRRRHQRERGIYGREVAIAALRRHRLRVANVIPSPSKASATAASRSSASTTAQATTRCDGCATPTTAPAISIGALGLLTTYLLRDQIPMLSGASAETASLIAYALPIFSIAYIFYGSRTPRPRYLRCRRRARLIGRRVRRSVPDRFVRVRAGILFDSTASGFP